MAKGKIGQGALKETLKHGFREIGNALYPGSPIVEHNPGSFLNPTPHEINQDRGAVVEKGSASLEQKLASIQSRDGREMESITKDQMDRDNGPEME